MKVDLFPFQREAVKELRLELEDARSAYLRRKKTQVVSLQAPTGSGKTIIAAALIESVYCGMPLPEGDFPEEQPDAIFVWLSDSPELNAQSMRKIEKTADKLYLGQCVTISEDNFDMEMLEDGHIYFLNTQKISKNGKLTQHSDNRKYTIWETLSNTIQNKSDRLYFFIDEAHRGAKTKAAQGADTTIMQRFIKGYEHTENGISQKMPSMPVVLGISATAKRFTSLIGNIPNVGQNSYAIKPEDVRSSGLLKDKIRIFSPRSQTKEDDIAYLEAAVNEWLTKCSRWGRYSNQISPKEAPIKVDPIFVVQVSQGSGGIISNTNLGDVLSKIQELAGKNFEEGEVVHCFGEETTLELNGLSIPHVMASDISDDHRIKVVFFKEALTTGWDCPRAETMMSYAVRNDPTYIAQLLGRMVRSPLQKRITIDDSLNDVMLFLPYYDERTVSNVVHELQGAEIPTEIDDESIDKPQYVTWTVHMKRPVPMFSSLSEINRSEILESINSKGYLNYCIRKQRTNDYLTSLLLFSNFLTHNDIYRGAREEVNSDVTEMIHAYVENLHRNGRYEEMKEQLAVFHGSMQVFDPFGKPIEANDDNQFTPQTDLDLERLFLNADKKLGGYGFPNSYINKYLPNDEPEESMEESELNKCKTDCILFALDETCLENLLGYAEKKLRTFTNKYRVAVANKSEEYNRQYKNITSGSAKISKQNFVIPERITVKVSEDGKEYHKHLLADENTGIAKIVLNGWESALIDEESMMPDFACWIRNQPRAEWALCLSYEINGETKAFYPDFLIVRMVPSVGFVMDILEPHGSQYVDSLPKAKALANYAKEERRCGRIQLIRKMNDAGGEKFIRLELTDFSIQDKVLQANNDDELSKLFAIYGVSSERPNTVKKSKPSKTVTISEEIIKAFSRIELPFLGCDYTTLYPQIAKILPVDSTSFSSFELNQSITCEILCAAICHQMNWDYLRHAIFEKTRLSKQWLQPSYLENIPVKEVGQLFSGYPKKNRIRKEERTSIIHAIGKWMSRFPSVSSVFLSDDGSLLDYIIITNNLKQCDPFVSDPEGKKLQLLIQKLSVYPQLSGLKNYFKPAIDYHLMRTYIRRGLLVARTQTAIKYLFDENVKRKDSTVAAIRQLCSGIMIDTCKVTSMDIATVNQIEWHIGRSVCVQSNPDCYLEQGEADWLKPTFSKCPFFETCAARRNNNEFLTINEPTYEGTSF